MNPTPFPLHNAILYCAFRGWHLLSQVTCQVKLVSYYLFKISFINIHPEVRFFFLVHLQGTGIGKCPKNKLFKGYIELELQLREFDRCRKLYEKYLEFSPENCTTWIKFAELETILGDVERARAIYELAIGQPRLDMPEVRDLSVQSLVILI